MSDVISTILLVFIIIIILVCSIVDLLRVDHSRPLPLQYRVRRFINWFILGLSYSSMYIGRYNFTLITNERIIHDIKISESQYGLVLSAGYWTYAVCAPFAGSIGDYIGSKPVVVVGVLGSGLINLILGLVLAIHSVSNVPPTLLFGFFNALNFISQALATGSINKINSGWYRKSELGIFGGIFSAVLATGFFFTFNVGNGILRSSLPWNFLFIIPGILQIICSTLIFLVVRDKPIKCGWNVDLTDVTHNTINQIDTKQLEVMDSGKIEMESISSKHYVINQSREEEEEKEELYNDNNDNGNIIILRKSIEIEKEQHHDDINISLINTEKDIEMNYQQEKLDQQLQQPQKKQSIFILIKSIFKEVTSKENIQVIISKDNILNAMSLFCSGWIKEGVISWFIPFLTNKFGPTPSQTILSVCSAGVSVGAMTGGLLCGLLSDYVFNHKRSPSLFLFYLFTNVLVIVLYFTNNQAGAALVLIILLILIFGANNVLAVTALLDLGTVRNAALMAGLLTTSQYVASGFSGILLGYIVEHLGFGWWLFSMLPFGIAAMVMMGYNSINNNNSNTSNKEGDVTHSIFPWRKWFPYKMLK